MRAPSASNSPSALSARALRREARGLDKRFVSYDEYFASEMYFQDFQDKTKFPHTAGFWKEIEVDNTLMWRNLITRRKYSYSQSTWLSLVSKLISTKTWPFHREFVT